MNKNNQKYRMNQYVEGKVEQLLPYGLFVRLNDGTRAYIRRRELTWSGNIDPRELWQAGDKIEGQVLKLAAPGQLLELSHRATLPDPWDAFVSRHRSGDVVEGRVKNLTSYGVYVEVEPGVDGLIPLSELAARQAERPEEVVWVGDVVEAVITYLDRHTKKLKLSARARLEQLKTVTEVMERCNLFVAPDAPTGQADEAKGKEGVAVRVDTSAKADLDLLTPESVGRILVLDDHPAIRWPIVAWFQTLGYEVDEAKDATEALQKVQTSAYGLMLVDINLPGMDGLSFIRQIRSGGLKCPIAVMSSAERLEEYHSEIEVVGVVEAFAKPLDLGEIEHLLAKIRGGEVLSSWHQAAAARQTKGPESFYQLTEAINTRGPLGDQLQAGLEQLVATTPAETGLIFYFDSWAQEVSILAQAGQVQLNQEASHTLSASPVRDVIIEGEQILENHMSGIVRERFRKLLDLFPFEACIGLPIPANEEINYALFLFHHEAGIFNRYHLRDALAAGNLFAVAVEREALGQRFRSLNKLLLSGQLASGFSHEVYNKMSGLEFQLRNLQTDCRRLAPQREGADPASEVREIGAAVDRLLETFCDLKDTVELFQQLMRTEVEQRLDLNDVVRKTVSLLRPSILTEGIRLETELSPDLPPLTGSPIRLQQVFLNIMLNAVQQMVLQAREGMALSITTLYEHADPDCPIKVRFADTGPGIHRQLWEKIFDLGFTTRPEGTGQGLYIARSLIESLGGKIRVERSIIQIGTTFLVELPTALAMGGGDDSTTVTRPIGG